MVQGGWSYEQYDSRTLAGEYLPSNRQQKQFTGNERIDGVILSLIYHIQLAEQRMAEMRKEMKDGFKNNKYES